MQNETEMSVDYLVAILAEAFGQIQVSELQLNIWNDALRHLSRREIRTGYDHLIRTRQDRRFPVPADLIAALHGTYEDAAVLGWNTAFRSILNHPGRHLEFEDPLIAETIRELGGVNFLSGMTQKDIQFQRKPFISTYMILAKKGKQDYDPVCKGQYRTASNRPIYIGKNQPALIEESQDDDDAPPF